MIETLPFPNYQCAKLDFICQCGKTQKHKPEKVKRQECRYWIEDPEVKNCVLRIDREYGAKETAKKLGISHQAVYKIENKIKRILRSSLHSIWEEYKESISEMRVW